MKRRNAAQNRVAVRNRDGHTIGLDIGATGIRATVLTQAVLDSHPTVALDRVGSIPLAEGVVANGVIQDPGALTTALKQLWRQQKFDCRHVILGVANQQVLVREISIPDLSPQQRAKALPFQAQEVAALPIDQVVLDFCQLDETDPKTNMMRGLLLATPREPILSAVAAVERAGLTVARVDLSSFGSLRSIAATHLAVEAIVDLGAHLTTVLIHDHGVPRLVRTLARGGQELTDKLADRMGISVADAEKAKRDIGLADATGEVTRLLTEALRPLLAEIRTSIQYYRSTGGGAAIEHVSLTGGGSSLRGIEAAFAGQIGLPAKVVDPMQHVRIEHAPKRASNVPTEVSAVSIGLAMGAAA